MNMKKLLFILLPFLGLDCYSQNCFISGTGADGAYTATVNTTLVGATYNFTSFTINPGVTVTITGNNPLFIYCTGTATIDGTLTANGGNGSDGVTYTNGGIGGIGVAGGANGGSGSFASGTGPIDGTDGAYTGGVNTKGSAWSGGGGAGYAQSGMSSGGSSGGFGGPAYGIADLSTSLAGSGGGGGSGGYDCGAGGGGAGGGFIFIHANNIIISATGMITANGGNGGSDGTGNCGGGGAGSGGGIWIGALSIQNDGIVSAIGGIGGASSVPGSPYYGVGGNGAVGRIRIDVTGSVSGSGSFTPGVGFQNNLAPVQSSQTVDLCFGETITVGSNVHSTPGTFVDVIPTVEFGCDSTVTTYLTVQNELTSTQTLTICNGASVSVGSNTYTTSGTFTDVLSSVISGCDSTVTTYLTVQNELTSTQTLTICNGASVSVGSNTYTTSGTFIDVLSSVTSGCDSTVTTNLTVESPIDLTINSILGDLNVGESGATYQWIDCDNGNSEINGEIGQTFTPLVNGNYAVEVTVNNCTETSLCFLVDFVGLEEIGNLPNNSKKLLKITDLLGRETIFQPNIVLIYIYSDGTIERTMIIN